MAMAQIRESCGQQPAILDLPKPTPTRRPSTRPFARRNESLWGPGLMSESPRRQVKITSMSRLHILALPTRAIDELVGIPGAGGLAHERHLGAGAKTAAVASLASQAHDAAEHIDRLPHLARPDSQRAAAIARCFDVDRVPHRSALGPGGPAGFFCELAFAEVDGASGDGET